MYKSIFKRNEGRNGIEYYGPFDYDNDEQVDVACDVIEILEQWDCYYEYHDDEKGLTWIKTRTCYEAGSLIEELFDNVNEVKSQA